MGFQSYRHSWTMVDHKAMILLEALRWHGYNRSATARCLNISVRTIRNFLNKYPKFYKEVPRDNIKIPRGVC